jgi:thiol:disulfide interchange protein/DsbC/DsbD-like thiol-disulfide interchange protein
MNVMKQLLFFLLCIASPMLLYSETETSAPKDIYILPTQATNSDIVSVKILPESLRMLPEKPFWFYIQFDMAPDWHLYWKNPGDAGAAPSIEWTLPEGFQAGEIFWPAPERFEIEDSIVFGYTHQLVLLAAVYAPKDLQDGARVKIGAKVHWVGCSTSCVPGEASFTMNFLASLRRAPIQKDIAEEFQQAKRMLPIEATKTKSFIQDDSIVIHVLPQMNVTEISKVWFFPDQQGIIDTKILPTWHVDIANNTIDVRIPIKGPLEKSALPIKGVLVVRDDMKNIAWDVQIPSGPVEVKNVNPQWAAQKHIEDLEQNVWYRKILNDFSQFVHSEFFRILLGAFIGGILLNIMPCVLPVISLKLLHFVELQGSSKQAAAKQGLIYSLGILVSFWALSGGIYILQAFGKSVGWGFQLQNPLFVACLTIVLFIFSLNLFGMFEFAPSLASFAGTLEQKAKTAPSVAAAFFSGVLATLVASPCTGPLLGSVIGFTAVLEPFRSFIVFTVLGIGMAFPFLLICLFPPAAKLIPRPGNWMVTFKQLMGFFMLATCLWLVWVLSAQTANLTVLTMLSTLFFISFGVWIFGTWGGLNRSRRVRFFAKILSFFVIALGSYILLSDVYTTEGTAKRPSQVEISKVVGQDWEPFTEPLLERRLRQHVPVFVSATAKWCLTCQANHLVLESASVRQAFIDYGVSKIEADWTMNSQEITRYIKSLGRNGVPLSVVYSKNPKVAPRILPEIITREIVIDALKWATEDNVD